MGSFDKKIMKQTDFKKVISSVVSNMLKIKADTEKIYIDLNSCLSILFRYDDINNPEAVEIISTEIERFLHLYLNDKVDIVILFTFEPSKVHTEIFPDWCKNRYQRVNYAKSDFLQTLLVSLHKFSESNPLIKVVNTHKVHPALVVYQNEKFSRKRSTVLSKDIVFQCLNLKNIVIYTGVSYIDLDDPMRPLPDDINLPEANILLPYYIALRGDIRNEFPGKPGYGPKKSFDYVMKNKLRIKSGIQSEDHTEKEWLDNYSRLYDINKLLELNKEEIKMI